MYVQKHILEERNCQLHCCENFRSVVVWVHLPAFHITEENTKHLINVYYIQIFIHALVFSLEGRAWQEPDPSHVTGMTLAHFILGKFLGVVCHWFLRLRWSWGGVLAFSTQVCGFKPGRSRRIFRAKKSSARLPSEGK